MTVKAAKVQLPNPSATVGDTVKLTKKVTVLPFETLYVMGIYNTLIMAKALDVMVEAEKEPFSHSIITVNSYSHIKQDFTWVPLGLHNHTCRVITIPTKTVVARVIAVNEVLPGPGPKVTNWEDNEMEWNLMETGKLNKLFKKLGS